MTLYSSSAFSLVRHTAVVAALCGLFLTACDTKMVSTPKDQGSNNTAASDAVTLPVVAPEAFSTKDFTAVEGRDYKVLPNPQPVQIAGKQEVIEFFWYGCSHCFAVEPSVEAWMKTVPSSVAVHRYHVQWGEHMQAHQRLAFALQQLGKSSELDYKVFYAIQRQGRALKTEPAITDFMVAQGINKEDWEKAYRGFDTNASILKADTLFRSYGLEGVPAFIVNGKYLVQGDTAHTLKVVNKLLEKK